MHHATFFVNSLAHYLGDQAYSDLHTAFDSMITALLTLGEGYHNYHHEFPQDYRNGIRWYQYDPTKWTIKLLYWLGLAYDLRWISDEEVEKAKLQVKKARLAEMRNKLAYGKDMKQNLPVLSARELQQLIDAGKSWIIVEDRVYDVTDFLDLHPGGRDTLLEHAGTDATAMFRCVVAAGQRSALVVSSTVGLPPPRRRRLFLRQFDRGETNEHIHSSAAEAMLARYLIGRPGDDVAESFGKAATAAH